MVAVAQRGNGARAAATKKQELAELEGKKSSGHPDANSAELQGSRQPAPKATVAFYVMARISRWQHDAAVQWFLSLFFLSLHSTKKPWKIPQAKSLKCNGLLAADVLWLIQGAIHSVRQSVLE